MQASGIIEPRREANSLLAFALQKDKTFLIAHPEYELSIEEETAFQNYLQRRASREPFQYIVGRQEFYGLEFAVTKDVLIPRPETEIAVEAAIEFLQTIENPTFCEIGIGSGCISVSILHETESARAIGLDISPDALRIAERNAIAHKVLNRLELQISDVFTILKDEKFDLIVSNPPYIPLADIKDLQAEVRDFEPLVALTDRWDGFSIVEKIAAEAPKFLNNNGLLIMEIGYGQAGRARAMFSPKIWRDIDILFDLQAIPRTIKAVKS